MTSHLDRSKKPLPKKEILFQLPEINTFKLGNGLPVFFVEKNDLPIVQFALSIDAGSRFDPPGKNGLAHLLSVLLEQGAGELDTFQLGDELERHGIIFDSSVQDENATLTFLSLSEKFDKALELFSLILFEPRLSQKDFEREKRKQITELLSSLSEPSYLAELVFRKNIFQPSSYMHPVLGSPATVGNIEHKDVTEFYRKYYRVQNSYLVVVGNIEQEELREKIEMKLGKWNNSTEVHFNETELLPAKRKIFLIDKKDAPQSEIILGHLNGKRNSPDYFPKRVFNSIFGGEFTSRLNSNLREEKGYTYGVHSAFYYKLISGYFFISTSVDTKNTINAVKEILNEFEKIKSEGVTEEETHNAKQHLINEFPSMFETYAHIVSRISTIVFFGLPFDYYHHYVENLRRVTTDDVNKVAKENISTDKLVLTLVGDKEKLLGETKKLSNFDDVVIVNDSELGK